MPATLNDIQAKYGESVYPLYKDQMHEPYMENDNGIGYKGVVMYDENQDKVQCADCGKWVSHMGSHLHFKHKKSASEYKTEHGLYQKVSLCSKKQSKKLSDQAKENMKKVDWSTIRQKSPTNPENSAKKRWSVMQSKNDYGLCDAQIASRIVVVLKQSNKNSVEELTSTDFSKYDHVLGVILNKKYGNWELASKALGLKFVGNSNEYEDAELLAYLRNLTTELGKSPTPKDLIENNGPAMGTFYKYFGSWTRAKMMAGLDQLLEEVKCTV
jgi:hypothetical protein